ncbi:MAG: hypothetical protein AMXMBFR76_10230 [Pseudomonadota bacterium]
MIQHTHVTAWQTHAPWPKRSQIEQDLRLSRGVAAIFADPVLSEHLAMRGGTVLHKAHFPASGFREPGAIGGLPLQGVIQRMRSPCLRLPARTDSSATRTAPHRSVPASRW